MTCLQSMGHKGRVSRPRCTGTERAQTQLFQIGKIGVESFQMLTFAFREEAMRQAVVFDCSAESRNGMISVKCAEY